jgi:hypothetical protein
MKNEYWLLLQYKSGWKRKLFTSEEQARKSAGLRPSYWYAASGRLPVQGGQLWHLVDGQPWTLVEEINGDYLPDKGQK